MYKSTMATYLLINNSKTIFFIYMLKYKADYEKNYRLINIYKITEHYTLKKKKLESKLLKLNTKEF